MDCINEWDYWREQPDWAINLRSSLNTSMAYQFTDEFQHDFYELFERDHDR